MCYIHPESKFFLSRIHIKKISFFNPENLFLSSLGNMTRVVHPGSPDPGSGS
jgi:hypothetical protein